MTRRVWGYGMWATMGGVLAVPEIAAAAGAGWQTISSTVGHLESRFWWVAVIVVGLMIATAFYAIHDRWAPKGQIATRPRVRRTRGGRYTRKTPASPLHVSPAAAASERVQRRWLLAAAAAFFVVGFGSYATDEWWGPPNKYRLGYVLYGLVALIWVVLPNAAAYSQAWDVPFPTLFRTVADMERRHPRWPILAVTVVGLGILLIHIAFYPWPDAIHDLNVLHQYVKHHPSGWPH
jgi:hypothetical protein